MSPYINYSQINESLAFEGKRIATPVKVSEGYGTACILAIKFLQAVHFKSSELGSSKIPYPNPAAATP